MLLFSLFSVAVIIVVVVILMVIVVVVVVVFLSTLCRAVSFGPLFVGTVQPNTNDTLEQEQQHHQQKRCRRWRRRQMHLEDLTKPRHCKCCMRFSIFLFHNFLFELVLEKTSKSSQIEAVSFLV